MKKLLAFALCCLVLSGYAHADIVDCFKRPEKKMQATEDGTPAEVTAAPIVVDQSTFVKSIATIIDALGARSGGGYDFKAKEFIYISGATIATKWNIALGLDLYAADGGGVSLNYNLGAALPVQDVPFIKILKYWYVGGGYGVRYYNDKWNKAYPIQTYIKADF